MRGGCRVRRRIERDDCCDEQKHTGAAQQESTETRPRPQGPGQNDEGDTDGDDRQLDCGCGGEARLGQAADRPVGGIVSGGQRARGQHQGGRQNGRHDSEEPG